ncbi:alpha/beta fold hydrolase [Litorimonas haliclonae]|uniref:alpha/beta fold hydrolase n=1 Tax=Litorimonas haliclonae TaxID=2081977 RepID=UPI0039EE73E9
MMRYLNSTILCTILAGALVACSPDPATDTDRVTEAERAEAITSPEEDQAPEDQSQATQTASSITVTRAGNPDGRTVVLIPGLASSDDVWDGTVEAMGDYDLRVVQVAGFAGADPVADISAEKIGDDIAAHLAEDTGSDTVLVGHSLGGFVAMRAALDHPNVIDELVIVDSLPYVAGLYMPEATPEMAANMAQQMTQQLASLPREQFNAQQQASFNRMSNKPESLSALKKWGETSDQATVATMMGELMGSDLRTEIGSLTQDVTVLVPFDPQMGTEKDQVQALYEAQYEAAPNVDIEVINDSFHFIMLDQPDAFYEAVKAELSD